MVLVVQNKRHAWFTTVYKVPYTCMQYVRRARSLPGYPVRYYSSSTNTNSSPLVFHSLKCKLVKQDSSVVLHCMCIRETHHSNFARATAILTNLITPAMSRQWTDYAQITSFEILLQFIRSLPLKSSHNSSDHFLWNPPTIHQITSFEILPQLIRSLPLKSSHNSSDHFLWNPSTIHQITFFEILPQFIRSFPLKSFHNSSDHFLWNPSTIHQITSFEILPQFTIYKPSINITYPKTLKMF